LHERRVFLKILTKRQPGSISGIVSFDLVASLIFFDFDRTSDYLFPNSVRLSFDLVASLIFFDFDRTYDYFFPNSVRISFDLVASLIFFDFDRTSDSDGIPPMKALPQCLGFLPSEYFNVPRIHRVPKSSESASIGLWNKQHIDMKSQSQIL